MESQNNRFTCATFSVVPETKAFCGKGNALAILNEDPRGNSRLCFDDHIPGSLSICVFHRFDSDREFA